MGDRGLPLFFYLYCRSLCSSSSLPLRPFRYATRTERKRGICCTSILKVVGRKGLAAQGVERMAGEHLGDVPVVRRAVRFQRRKGDGGRSCVDRLRAGSGRGGEPAGVLLVLQGGGAENEGGRSPSPALPRREGETARHQSEEVA